MHSSTCWPGWTSSEGPWWRPPAWRRRCWAGGRWTTWRTRRSLGGSANISCRQGLVWRLLPQWLSSFQFLLYDWANVEILSSLSFCRKRGIISAIIKSTTSKVLLFVGYNSWPTIDLINSCSFSSNIKLLQTQEIQWRRKRIYHEIISSRLWQVSSAWRLRWKRLCSTWKRAVPEARLLFLFIVFAFVFIWSLVMNLSQGLIYIINYHAYVVSYNVMKPCQMDVMQQY